jgi:hypothetical protein
MCYLTKPLSEFPIARINKDGRYSYCKLCKRAQSKGFDQKNPGLRASRERGYVLKRKYGITQEQFDEILLRQGGRCAICRSSEASKSTDHRFSVDHDHETGQVRGLLCKRCNSALGHFQDNPEIVESALSYLTTTRRKDS